jgi:hypothetical protein
MECILVDEGKNVVQLSYTPSLENRFDDPVRSINDQVLPG